MCVVRAWPVRLQRAAAARVGGAGSRVGAHARRGLLRAADRAPAPPGAGARGRARDHGCGDGSGDGCDHRPDPGGRGRGRAARDRGSRLMLRASLRAGDFLVAESQAMRAVAAQVEAFADGDAPVLISGEHGTGRELVARVLHQRGPRGQAHFIAVRPTFESSDVQKVDGDDACERAHRALRAAAGGTLVVKDVIDLTRAVAAHAQARDSRPQEPERARRARGGDRRRRRRACGRCRDREARLLRPVQAAADRGAPAARAARGSADPVGALDQALRRGGRTRQADDLDARARAARRISVAGQRRRAQVDRAPARGTGHAQPDRGGRRRRGAAGGRRRVSHSRTSRSRRW